MVFGSRRMMNRGAVRAWAEGEEEAEEAEEEEQEEEEEEEEMM